jgi:hypothetical protein
LPAQVDAGQDDLGSCRPNIYANAGKRHMVTLPERVLFYWAVELLSNMVFVVPMMVVVVLGLWPV